MQLEFRWCGVCRSDQLFEQPPCEDGHDDGCLDFACCTCGAGLVLGLTQLADPVRAAATQVA